MNVHEIQQPEVGNDDSNAIKLRSVANNYTKDIVLPNILLIGAQKSGTTSVSFCNYVTFRWL